MLRRLTSQRAGLIRAHQMAVKQLGQSFYRFQVTQELKEYHKIYCIIVVVFLLYLLREHDTLYHVVFSDESWFHLFMKLPYVPPKIGLLCDVSCCRVTRLSASRTQ
jgi:hypothetical protein